VEAICQTRFVVVMMSTNNDRTAKTPKYATKTQFWKPFEDHGLFLATIDGFDTTSGFYHVTYDDGDEEELTERNVTKWIKKDLTPDKDEADEKYASHEPILEKNFDGNVVKLVCEDDSDRKPSAIDARKQRPAETKRRNNDTTTRQDAAEIAPKKRSSASKKKKQPAPHEPKKTPKYAVGTKIWKQFAGHANPFEGVIERYDYEEGFYHIRYLADGDEEDMYEREVTRWLNNASLVAPNTPVVGMVSSQKGRSITKISYCMDDDSHDDDDDDEKHRACHDEEEAPRRKKRNVIVGSSARKRNIDDDDDEKEEEISPRKKLRTNTRKRPSVRKRLSKTDSDSDASVVSDSHELIGEDLLGNDVRSKGRPEAPDPKEYLAQYDPTPIYPDLSLQEIKATKEYLDPRVVEFTDNIVDQLVGEQVTKIGGLLGRALRNKQTLGSVNNPLSLGTACTGTDAVALALTMVQEQMKQRQAKFQSQEHIIETDDTVEMKDDKASDKGSSNDDGLGFLHYSHKFSCEKEHFKQAYIARNFDSIVYPDIAKLCENAPRDVYGQVQPLPRANLLVASTLCQNFGMSSATKRLDVYDSESSSEIFFDVVKVILQEKPQICILENVTEAPWQKMADYICGRIKLSDCDSQKASENSATRDDSKQESKTDQNEVIFSFSLEVLKIVVEAVPSLIGIQCGATVFGYLKGIQGKIYPVEWPINTPKTANCTLVELLKANKIDKKSDTLVFDRAVTYCCHWTNVDTKDYGLPQTRPRTYMFVWQPVQKPPGGHFHPDDLGNYFEAVMQYLESNIKHSLEAFTLQLDHREIRKLREALRIQLSCKSFGAECAVPDVSFTNTSDEKLPRDNAAGMPSGIKDEMRFMTNGRVHGKKVPPQYWLDHLNCNSELSDVTRRDDAPYLNPFTD
jgi:site-specific DNA-cytosine methylase